MSRRISRRRAFKSVLAGCAVATSGCLRLQASGEGTTDANPETTDASGTDDPASTDQSTTRSETTATDDVLREDWTVSRWGSEAIPYEDTFYVSTWVSKQIYALRPDGEELWRTDEQTGKFKQHSLAVDDDVVVGCGYDGKVVALDRASGDVRWEFSDGEYATWSAQPLVTDRYVVGANAEEGVSFDETRYVVYVLDRQSGEVVTEFAYGEDAREQDEPFVFNGVRSVDLLGDRLLVNCHNYVELYDASSLEEVGRLAKFGYGNSGMAYDGDWLSISASGYVRRYELTDSESNSVWAESTRGSVQRGPVVDGDSVYAAGEAGVFSFSLDSGDPEWEGRTEARVLKDPAVTTDHVWVVDEFEQLYGFRREDGEQVVKRTLPADSEVLSLRAIDDRLLVAMDPLTVYEVG